MTDPTPPPSHLDDEDLSAVLDGEGRSADRAHAVSCPTCAGRLARLRAVAAAVGAPMDAVDPARRTAAVAAAVARAGTVPEMAPVVPIERRRGGMPRWVLAAAVLVLLAMAVPVVARFAGGGDGDDTATSATTAEPAADATTGGALEAAPSGPRRDAGDLGDIDADTNLPDRLGLSDQPPGPITTTPAGEAGTDAPAMAASAAAPCEDALRAADPQLGALLVSARARLDGDPAAVLGFEAGEGFRVYAVAVGTCELRIVQTAR